MGTVVGDNRDPLGLPFELAQTFEDGDNLRFSPLSLRALVFEIYLLIMW
jgi:hypothetical protein